ncbi:hypothetical protein KC19_VG130700 [Ceratodon purpureus]|uniref:Uncharacterized protein n=1 Tax=Ceratodon purpureus TaxID=3225 RepID=A0A8T0HQM7_CERPU|nr:hypothetical protein KC19_VG130700 [Ceratodon purpureus]
MPDHDKVKVLDYEGWPSSWNRKALIQFQTVAHGTGIMHPPQEERARPSVAKNQSVLRPVLALPTLPKINTNVPIMRLVLAVPALHKIDLNGPVRAKCGRNAEFGQSTSAFAIQSPQLPRPPPMELVDLSDSSEKTCHEDSPSEGSVSIKEA